MTTITIKDVDRTRYRPTKYAEEFLGELRTLLGLNDKATAARLAIARSVTEPVISYADIVSKMSGAEKGMAIEGVHLFGDQSDLWATIIASTIEEVIEDPAMLRILVEFHWQRGADLLQDDYNDNNKNYIDFILHLASRLPKLTTGLTGSQRTINSTGNAVSDLISIQLLTDQQPWGLNASGGNGLMVISGRPGTGKSQLGLDLLAQASAYGARFLFFDLKGELQDSSDDNEQRENRDRFLAQTNASYIQLIDSQLPINPLVSGATGAERAQIASEIAHLVRCFASQLGANQERSIRDAYEDSDTPDINSIVQGLENRGEEGVALSIFDKIQSFNIFSDSENAIAIEEWLRNSIVIDFSRLGNDNETKSLVVALILNTIMRQLSRQLQIVDGIQPLQMILFVDEAHLLLPKEGKAGLLGSLARQGRSWGFPVWLASQDADAFITKGQNSTDFSQLADCALHLSPQTLSESQQRQILGQVIHKKLAPGEGVLRLKGSTQIGQIRQYWRDRGRAVSSDNL